MILHFVTHAVAERQILAHAEIVLNVPAELILPILHRRIADALRVLRRQSGFESSEIGKLKRAERIGPIVTAIAARFELRAETNAMFLERVVDVVCELEVELTVRPPLLCALPSLKDPGTRIVCPRLTERASVVIQRA